MEQHYRDTTEEIIEYYDSQAEEYTKATVHADMSAVYARFEALLHLGCSILDAGSGSGRDSLYFAQKGYAVTAMDASQAMCDQTAKLAGVPVFHQKVQEMDFTESFDAVWACASLLHVEEKDMKDVLLRIARALKPEGILYASWKLGEGQRKEGPRTFTDYNEERLRKLLKCIPEMEVKSMWISGDTLRRTKHNGWINVLMKKMTQNI